MDMGVPLAVAMLLVLSASVASGNIAFEVHSKFKGSQRSLSALREHDSHRHGRLLSVDVPLGGDGNPAVTGLYYTKIGIGNPPVNYSVQIDTGSDILWVNCAGCDKCPAKSDIVGSLQPYDPKGSSTGKMVMCDHDFCKSTSNSPLEGCKQNMICQYNVVYGDGSSTAGYYVEDEVHLNQMTGNLPPSTNASVRFGCATRISGDLSVPELALSGIMGFGQSNSSMLSQLASEGIVKRIFSHCLDSEQGGGIFSIGEVVEPKVKTTSLVSNTSHYTVVMKGLEVGGEPIQLGTSPSGSSEDDRQVIIDSGSTLVYLPENIHDQLMSKILARQPGLKITKIGDHFSCIQFFGDLDDGFPAVTFHFADSLNLTAYPHDYLFIVAETKYCFGVVSGAVQFKEGKDAILLGDLVLSNKLVVYDLVNQTIGWVDHNCSLSVKVKDEKSGVVYSIGAHNLSSATALVVRRILTWLFLIPAILYSFMW